jgi:AmmeMemoRadiSam system protein B
MMFRIVLAIVFLALVGGCNGTPDRDASAETPQAGGEARAVEAAPAAERAAPNPGGEPRPAAVAGAFYPGDPAALRRMVEAFVAEGRKGAAPGGGRVLGIAAPHAGYVYSGLTAGYAFAAVEGRSYDTVLLLGSPHTTPVRGAAVFCGPGFETPLGVAEVDVDLAKAVVSASPLAQDLRAPHAREHSLEVHLPFLTVALGSYRFVPILIMGDREILDPTADAIYDALISMYGADVRPLVVVSTDLAH